MIPYNEENKRLINKFYREFKDKDPKNVSVNFLKECRVEAIKYATYVVEYMSDRKLILEDPKINKINLILRKLVDEQTKSN